MSFRGIATAIIAGTCLWVSPALGQDEDPLEPKDSGVLEGVFVYSDPQPGSTIRGIAVSSSNIVFAGGSVTFGAGVPTVCVALTYALQASDLIKRGPTKIKEKQREELQIQFFFYDCSNPTFTPECVLGASEPVAIDSCKALTKVNAGDPQLRIPAEDCVKELVDEDGNINVELAEIIDVEMGGILGVEAKVNILCPDGIDVDQRFELTSAQASLVDAAFPALLDAQKIKYKDEAACMVAFLEPEEEEDKDPIEKLLDLLRERGLELGLSDCP